MRPNRTVRYFTSHISKLPQLTKQEKHILLERLKLMTLEKIGSFYNLTEARIRQIEKNAIKKIPKRHYQLRLFKRLS